MPGTIELVIAGLIIAAYPLWDYFIAWPRMAQAIAAGRPGARVSAYRETIALQWIVAAVIAAAWVHAARPWSALGVTLPSGWRLALALGLIAALAVLIPQQVRAIRRIDPARRARIRIRAADQSALIPRNLTERAWFGALSISAGICEELIYRGFLVWCLQPWLGLWGAALAATLSFGSAHLYQGFRGATRAATVGGLFALLAIAMHSIVPGMILHALLDILSGESSYQLFADEAAAAAATPAAR